MPDTTKSSHVQKAYPPEFTHLVAEVVDTAMKAIMAPDPLRYIQHAAVNDASELRRLRCNLAPHRRRDRALAAAFQCDMIRNRVVRDLAVEIIESYERLKQAENKVLRVMMSPEQDVRQRKDGFDGKRDRPRPVLVIG